MQSEKAFTVFITGVKSNDYAVKRYIGKGKSYVFYKLPYAPPYQGFNGIRDFQVITRFKPFEDSTQKNKYAVVDLSEWVGHEREEYLEIFMKFLHDYSGYFEFEYIFTVGNAKRNQIQELLVLAATYLEEVNVHEDLTLVEEKKLAKYIQLHFEVEKNCAAKLAQIFIKNNIDGYTQLHVFMNDICRHRYKNKNITEEIILDKPAMQTTKFYLIYEKEVDKWRTERLERQWNKCS